MNLLEKYHLLNSKKDEGNLTLLEISDYKHSILVEIERCMNPRQEEMLKNLYDLAVEEL